MNLPKKIEKKLNEQINAEFFSAYLYKAMAAYFTSINFEGFSSWMDKQAAEELGHGLKFYDYINSRLARVVLDSISKPKTEWNSPLEAFEAALEHEKYVTSLIYNLVELAKKEKDYATENFLQWFVVEQTEEEETADSNVQKLKMAGTDKFSLLLLDKEFGQRK